MYSPEIEQKPQPAQAFRLASIGMCLANRQGKAKPSRNHENAHFFLLEMTEEAEIRDNVTIAIKTHRFLGRIAKTDYRRWSMLIAEPYWVETDDDSDWSRNIYKFRWTRDEVHVAEKQLVLPSNEPDFFDILPEDIGAKIDEGINENKISPDIIHAESQLKTLSAGDCRVLINDLREFSASPKLKLNYNR